MDPTWSLFAGAARLGVRRLDAALGFAVTRVMSRPDSIDLIFENHGPSGGNTQPGCGAKAASSRRTRYHGDGIR